MFKIGGKQFTLTSAEYDRDLQGKVARYRPRKFIESIHSYEQLGTRKPLFTRPLDQVEEFVNSENHQLVKTFQKHGKILGRILKKNH